MNRGVDAPSLKPSARLFAAPADQPRARRATDLVLLIPALLGLALVVIAYPPSSTELALERMLATLPNWLDSVWQFLEDLLWLWAAVLVLAALARRRFVVVAQALAAVVLAALVAVTATRLAVGTWPDLLTAATGGGPRFPTVWVAEATAVCLTVSPHLIHPLRVFSRRLVAVSTVAAAVVAAGTPAGILAAVLVAVVVAASIRLAWGTSIGRPGLTEVAAGLAELGVDADALQDAERQVVGVFHVRASDRDGRPLLIKVYGRDAHDTQLVTRLWRYAWYRGAGTAAGPGRLQAAEHEAFVTLLAANGGVATQAVVTAGATLGDDALLVLRGEARAFGVDNDLAAAWDALGRLGDLRIAHRAIDPATLALVDGRAGFVDFGAATVAPDAHQLAADRAQLLLTTAIVAGEDAALAAARTALGDDGLATLLPYLQTAAVTTALRRALKIAAIDVDELRTRAAALLEVEPPELFKVRRLSVWSVAQLVLLALASYTIITAAGSVDWDELGTILRDATWGFLAGALITAQLPRACQALATLGAVPMPLRYGPIYAMQLASGYMNVALPSSLARMAVSVRFFQRQGLSVPTAVASGAIDTIANALVQALLLVLLLIFSEASLELDLPLPEGSARTLAWILIGLLALTAALAFVPRVRRVIADRAREAWPDVRAALAGLRSSHRLALLGFGNVAAELLFAITLGLIARGLGYDLSLADLLLIQVTVALISGIIPVPGGIGVAELGLTVGLSAAGMSEEAALATALLQRIATFYLPPLWGFFALRWLQRGRYL
ncbi:MAG TPA: lysylphosphatidylglycerol synthase transmembrane domain-containing protein [Solirubrobacter sp.]|nr:lysylphosphatidylglycerol synthase transmembrane domain-containing protein [Solirubrobacter sp.]